MIDCKVMMGCKCEDRTPVSPSAIEALPTPAVVVSGFDARKSGEA
jgi:hypothetical protein